MSSRAAATYKLHSYPAHYEVTIEPAALEVIEQIEWDGAERAAALFGYWDIEGRNGLVVETGVEVSGEARFSNSPDFDVAKAREYAGRFERSLGASWVGDAHSHPAGSPNPSRPDLAAFAASAIASRSTSDGFYFGAIVTPPSSGLHADINGYLCDAHDAAGPVRIAPARMIIERAPPEPVPLRTARFAC